MKKHYWISAAELTFADGNGGTGVTRVNVIVSSENDFITSTELMKIQQGAGVTLFNKLQEEVNILNITVVMLTKLGYMTEEEFTAGASEFLDKAKVN